MAVVAALEIPLALSISGREKSQFENRLLINAALLASRINDDIPVPVRPARQVRADPAIQRLAADSAAAVAGARIVVVDQVGRVLTDTAGDAALGEAYMTEGRPEFASAINPPENGGRVDIRERRSEDLGDDLVIVTAPIVHEQQAVGAVRVTASLGAVQSRVRRSLLALGLVGLLAILAGLAAAWFLATWLTRPVCRLEEAAVRFGQGDFDARADPQGPEEIATLATSFNRMAGAVSANILAQRDFLANASHQLRTPLTGIKLRLEAIRGEGGASAEQARKAEVEVDRLSALVDDLLELARVSSVDTEAEQVDLSDLASAAVDRWSGPAQRAGQRVVNGAAGPCRVVASVRDLEQVLDNLIENSIRYSPPGSAITVEAGARGRSFVLAVADDGPGIQAADRDRVFERFYRGSAGRQAGPGTGLGLAVVAELVRRWGGEVSLASSNGSSGTRVEASFPSAASIP